MLAVCEYKEILDSINTKRKQSLISIKGLFKLSVIKIKNTLLFSFEYLAILIVCLIYLGKEKTNTILLLLEFCRHLSKITPVAVIVIVLFNVLCNKTPK